MYYEYPNHPEPLVEFCGDKVEERIKWYFDQVEWNVFYDKGEKYKYFPRSEHYKVMHTVEEDVQRKDMVRYLTDFCMHKIAVHQKRNEIEFYTHRHVMGGFKIDLKDFYVDGYYCIRIEVFYYSDFTKELVNDEGMR